MDALTVGLLCTGALFGLILIGFHIGVALMLTSYVGVYFIVGRPSVAANLLKNTAFSAVNDYVFAVIPLFVLMGLLATQAGATRDLFSASEALLRRVRGGLGIATVAANAIFAAITGVSVASAAVFSKIAVPEMQRLNYQLRFSLGIVASSALLGMLIPPSILLIVYGVITEQSVGLLFAAGIMPGLLVALTLSLTIWGFAVVRPGVVGGSEALRALAAQGEGSLTLVLRAWPLYLLILLVLGGLYGGLFTPTEAGAVGAFGALLILVLRRRFTPRGMLELLLETGRASAGIFFLFITASMYGRMLTLSQLPATVAGWVTGLEVAPIFVLLAFVVILLLLGMILDSVSILLLTIPIMAPVIDALGYDPIWFGIVAIVTIEIGLLTPPFGMVVFAMKAALPPEVTLEDIYIGAAPFLLTLLATLALLIAFPAITLAVPRLLYS